MARGDGVTGVTGVEEVDEVAVGVADSSDRLPQGIVVLGDNVLAKPAVLVHAVHVVDEELDDHGVVAGGAARRTDPAQRVLSGSPRLRTGIR